MVAAAATARLTDENLTMRFATGVVFVVVGAVWVLQGFDVAFAPTSFMTGQRQWVVWGSIAVVLGLGLIWWDRRPGDRIFGR